MISPDQMMTAVLQNPQDDAARLRLADFMVARGDPRGEFIKLKVELARLAPNADVAEPPARRARELLITHQDEWVGPLADWLIDWTFRRGFIDEVTVEAEVLVAQAENLLAAAPIQSLRLHNAGAVSEELAACPQLARVKALHFGSDDGDSEPLGDEGLVALAASPHLAGLEALTFSMEQIGGDGLQALARAPWLAGLRRLALPNNEVGADALASFLAVAPLQELEALNLDWTGAGSETVAVLAQSAPLAMLRELSLANNKIGRDGPALLATAGRLPRLSVLDLNCTYLKPGSLQPLSGSPLLAQLTELRLASNNDLEAGDLSALLESSALPALKALVLGSVKMGDAAAQVVARCAALQGLTRLEIPCGGLSADGVKALAASPHLTNLETLNLFSNKGTSAAAEALAASATMANLRSLTVSNNSITDDGAQALAQSQHLTKLRALSLRANALTVAGIKALAASPALRHLQSLDLGYLGLPDEAAEALAGSATLANLESLVLASNKISGAGARALASSTELALLTNLDLRRNSMDADAAGALRSTFGRRVRLGR
jgi:uncharacterized protein (TIGR02996 family)